MSFEISHKKQEFWVKISWKKFILYVMLMEQETLIESLYKSMYKNYDAIVSSYE